MSTSVGIRVVGVVVELLDGRIHFRSWGDVCANITVRSRSSDCIILTLNQGYLDP